MKRPKSLNGHTIGCRDYTCLVLDLVDIMNLSQVFCIRSKPTVALLSEMSGT